MFGAWSWAFLYWSIFGAITVFVVLGAKVWFEDRGIVMNWWKWTILGIWYALFIGAYTAPFTIMGEGTEGAAWAKMLAFDMVIMAILGVGAYRLMLIGRKTDDAGATDQSNASEPAAAAAE